MDWLQEALANVPSQVDDIKPVPSPVEGRTLIVDGDYLAYYAAGNNDTDAGRARQNAREKIQAFCTFTGATKVVIHLTASTSNKGLRFAVAQTKPYQGQRTGNKPANWQHLRMWMETYQGDEFKTKLWYDREADDGMAYHAAVLGDSMAVIATADKDMRMFAGLHIHWHDYHVVHVAPNLFSLTDEITGKVFGHKWFWLQMLQGDTADNIPGLPFYVHQGSNKRIGERTAERMLADCTDNATAFGKVASLYASYYKNDWPEKFVEQAVLLWMRVDQRAEIDDFMTIVPSNEAGAELLPAVEALRQRLRDDQATIERLENGTD